MPPKRTGTGFINLQTYLDLNRGAADAMGGAVAEDVEKAGQGVTSDLEALKQKFQPGAVAGTSTLSGMEGWSDLTGRALDAQGKANAAGTMGGTATLLREKYGGNNTWGGGMLDAALARAGGAGGRLAGAQGAYGRLVEKLGAANDASAKQAAPTAAAPAAPKVEYAKPGPGPQYKQDQFDEYGYERLPRPKPTRVVRGSPVKSAY